MNKRVFLDNNATTKPDEAVVQAMSQYLTTAYGNPSSVHYMGVEAEQAISKQRRKIADYLETDAEEIYFTSGATEAHNLIINAVANRQHDSGHIVTTAVEHSSVRDVILQLQQEGVDVTWVHPSEEGTIDARQIARAVTDDTFLVSMMHVNNETGVIFPVEEAAQMVKAGDHQPIFHVDGVQAFGKYPVDLKHIDVYTISGHKIHAPKGTGAFYLDKNRHVPPLLRGGGQEQGVRSGTENVPGIVGLGKAVELMYRKQTTSLQKLDKLRQLLVEILRDEPDMQVNTSMDNSLPTTLNMSFPPVPGEVIVNALSEEGIYVSSGSACSSRSGRESHVLRAMDIEGKYLRSSVRFSFSRLTTRDEVILAGRTLKRMLPRLKKVAKLKKS